MGNLFGGWGGFLKPDSHCLLRAISRHSVNPKPKNCPQIFRGLRSRRSTADTEREEFSKPLISVYRDSLLYRYLRCRPHSMKK